MESGLSERFPEKVSPVKRHIDHMIDLGAKLGVVRQGLNNLTSDVIKMFAYAAREYSQKHPGVKFEDYVDITYKNRLHGAQNPKCCFPRATTKESIGERRRMLCDPITLGMAAPTCDGGAAAVVCSEQFMRRHNLQVRMLYVSGRGDIQSSNRNGISAFKLPDTATVTDPDTNKMGTGSNGNLC